VLPAAPTPRPAPRLGLPRETGKCATVRALMPSAEYYHRQADLCTLLKPCEAKSNRQCTDKHYGQSNNKNSARSIRKINHSLPLLVHGDPISNTPCPKWQQRHNRNCADKEASARLLILAEAVHKFSTSDCFRRSPDAVYLRDGQHRGALRDRDRWQGTYEVIAIMSRLRKRPRSAGPTPGASDAQQIWDPAPGGGRAPARL
jgi:hypothetical protein